MKSQSPRNTLSVNLGKQHPQGLYNNKKPPPGEAVNTRISSLFSFTNDYDFLKKEQDDGLLLKYGLQADGLNQGFKLTGFGLN